MSALVVSNRPRLFSVYRCLIYTVTDVEPAGVLPESALFVLEEYCLENGKLPKITWRDDVPEAERRRLEALALPRCSYRELVQQAERAENCPDVHDHIWEDVNAHLGTDARSFPELVEKLGIMRFGHRPRVADTFCGSGQIPFEAARLGCDVYASDLNPIACMLTWGAFHIGGSAEERRPLPAQEELVESCRPRLTAGRGDGRTGLAGQSFSLLRRSEMPADRLEGSAAPTRVISKGYRVIAGGS